MLGKTEVHCPCVIGEAKYAFLDKSDPEEFVTYTVSMLTYCTGAVSMAAT